MTREDPPQTTPQVAEDPLQGADLTFLLGMAFQLVHAEFVSRINALGYDELRPVHGMVFQALHRAGTTSTELAERLGVTKQAAGQIVDYLEERGYVRREPHPDGGRRRLVVLTDKARQHLAVAGRVLYSLEVELASQLDPEALTSMRRQLARLIREFAGDTLPPLRPLW
ncbi:MarR family winged helix-turn-helix transcriptional regulator [Streptomyces sp. NPDC048473]|uniref:MarR family winged helix-turn-helix transcriptional regulator n=1 Tax=unclassified Streptomyces TaxID=2593676 RepID=UPI003723FFD5